MSHSVFYGAVAVTALAMMSSACEGHPTPERTAPPTAAATALPHAPAVTSAPATILASSALPTPPHARTLSVPRTSKPLTPSSHFDVDFWGSAVNTHTLLDAAGKGAVPVSEARFLWGNGQLYVAFYAGDLDLEVREKAHDGPLWKDDSVTLSFFTSDGKKRLIAVSPAGVLADAICPTDAMNWGDARCDVHWESHARIGADYDGTLNKLGDFDEEWNIQFAIPLRSLDAAPTAGTTLSFTLHRCDMAFDGQRACGEWGSNDSPAQLVLE
jgi:hypothetical protein